MAESVQDVARPSREQKSWRPTTQRLAQAEAEVGRLSEISRREDTRRKILLGALLIAAAEDDGDLRNWIVGAIQSLTRPADKKLFANWSPGTELQADSSPG